MKHEKESNVKIKRLQAPVEDEYRKCHLCDVAYTVMLRLLIKYPKGGYIYLCRNCFDELRHALNNWDWNKQE